MEKADPPGITEAQESLALFFVQILFRPLLNHVIRSCVLGKTIKPIWATKCLTRQPIWAILFIGGNNNGNND